MSENIINADLINNTVIDLRTVYDSTGTINSIDIDHSSGKFIVTKPLDENGFVNNEVVIYPASPQLTVNQVETLTGFAGAGDFSYPCDAKFDSVRRKIWIADTLNNRVFKADMDSLKEELVINDVLYPHAIAVNTNTGGAYIKAYSDYSNVLNVISVDEKGNELARFISSISTSAESSSSSSSSESSSSSLDYIPIFPQARTIVYDHVRSRVWWLFGRKLYMLDEQNLEIRSFDVLKTTPYSYTVSVDVEFRTGYPLVMAKNSSGTAFILQISRDNNKLLATAYM